MNDQEKTKVKKMQVSDQISKLISEQKRRNRKSGYIFIGYFIVVLLLSYLIPEDVLTKNTNLGISHASANIHPKVQLKRPAPPKSNAIVKIHDTRKPASILREAILGVIVVDLFSSDMTALLAVSHLKCTIRNLFDRI